MQDIARARRPWPIDLPACTNNPLTEYQAVHQKLHGNGGGMPSTGGQPLKERALGRLCIQMERLWIKLAGKADNLRFIQSMFCAANSIPRARSSR